MSSREKKNAEGGGRAVLPRIAGQLQDLPRVILAAYLPALLVLGLPVSLWLLKGKPIHYFTQDPAAIAGTPFYYGFLSNVGILLWSAAATVCLFSFLLLRRRSGEGEAAAFALHSGILTLVLALDDLFQFHEAFFPIYLGIDEKLVLGGYAAYTLYFLVRFRNAILDSDFLLLFLAFAFFGASIFADFLPHGSEGHYLFEDGAKFFGIVGWTAYFFRTCLARNAAVLPAAPGTSRSA